MAGQARAGMSHLRQKGRLGAIISATFCRRLSRAVCGKAHRARLES